ncbi:MAG: glycosyltransferase family 2 protein [Bacteroidales bacterium]|nr:glycosyltransferase family 2 protein [Bacteroidales bacterium]
MKFSVIVPIYNVDKYLRTCIESVLYQSYTNFELILIDDGSPDKSPSICDEYAQKDNRIIVIHKVNGGLVSARKAGVNVASGQYAVCLDGDDFLHKDCLKIVYETIRHNEKVDVVCFGFNLYKDDSVVEKSVKSRCGYYDYNQIVYSIYPELFYSRSSRRFPHEIAGKAIRLELYKHYQLKVPSDIRMAEDASCIHPLLTNIKSIYILGECLYYYRQITSSMTKVRKPLDWDNYDKVFALYEKQIDFRRHDFRRQYYRLRTHNLFNVTMSQFYSDKPYTQIVSQILSRFKKHPEYDEAINNGDFASIHMKFIRYLLKYRCFRVIRFYAHNRLLLKTLKERIGK